MFIDIKPNLNKKNHQVSDKSNSVAIAAPASVSVGINGGESLGFGTRKHFSFEYLKCNLGCVWIFWDALDSSRPQSKDWRMSGL